MSMYTRVFSTILDSSIWQEELHVRCLWIVLLIIAEDNRDGTVNVPIGRLAQKAGITEEQTRDALERLMSPDPDSDSPDEEGRRIVPLIPERPTRGWRLVNWKKYQDISNAQQRREQVAANMKRYRNKGKEDDNALSAVIESDLSVIPITVPSPSPVPKKTLSGEERQIFTKEFEQCWAAYPRKQGKASAAKSYVAQVRPLVDGQTAMLSAIKNYKEELRMLGRTDQYTMHGSRFFNHVWRDYVDGTWTPPKPVNTNVASSPIGRYQRAEKKEL